jgi:hypothetical protein
MEMLFIKYPLPLSQEKRKNNAIEQVKSLRERIRPFNKLNTPI